MGDNEAKIRFAFFMGRRSNLAVNEVLSLMRAAATHRRIETELTNGYKLPNGNEDTQRKLRATQKREEIDARMEALCKVSYGALTVSVVIEGQEVYIP